MKPQKAKSRWHLRPVPPEGWRWERALSPNRGSELGEVRKTRKRAMRDLKADFANYEAKRPRYIGAPAGVETWEI